MMGTTVQPFTLQQVRLLEGVFKEAMLRDQRFLLELEPDRLLRMFRVNVGLPSTAEPYGGWESPDCELRGHSLGHYMSACSLLFASGGDAALKTRVEYLVAELAKCQAAGPTQGFNAGFLSAYPESFFDRVDERNPVWAPYYTLHKILAGLVDAYRYCGSQQALDVLKGIADWLIFRVGRLTLEQFQISLLNEPGGVNEPLADLYAITGEQKYLDLSLAFNHEQVLDPLAHGEDHLDRFHANTQIPKAIAVARQYELTGEKRLHDIARFFWERVALHRSYVIGGHSDDELFFPVDRFAQHLSTVTAETCNTYNMLKLTRHLFVWEPDAQLMDYYERALYNHILASQDPETGMMTYFVSLKPGHVKIYNTRDHSFWCCTGTGMENHAKYGDTIYFHDDASLYVNLFIASELNWAEKRIVLRQETRFPEQDTTSMTLHCQQPTKVALKIRYPTWAAGLTVSVNGQPQTISATPGSYVSIEREWQDGDRVEVKLPMSLHIENLPGTDDMVALLYGPLVLAGALGTDDMPDVYLHGSETRTTPLNRLPVPQVPVLVGSAQDVLAKVKPADGELAFRTEGLGSPHDVELIPFYQLHHQRYTVYWQLRANGQ
ncbi:MAG: glycoside hydrolase family 127 protein [Anaerolineae bacterium]